MKIRNLLFAAGATIACGLLSNQALAAQGTKRSITLPQSGVYLKEGPGMDTTRRYCGICHSLDYITTQQKFPRARWQAVVTKMIKTYGAPIPDKDAAVIVDYISTNYGSGK